MPRLPPITAADLNAEQRVVLDAIQAGPRGAMGLAGPFGVYVRAPAVGQAAQALGAAVRFGTLLEETLREIAICTVGAHFRAKFEFAAHAELALRAGVAPAVVEALRLRQMPVFVDEAEGTVHAIATALLVDHRLDDALHDRGMALLGQTRMIELVTTVGYYCLVSLTLNAFEVPLEDGMVDPFPDLPG
ncbi:MAG TPA: carboxymuconolactone decarboxylase family protein [Pseudomonadales bacterium]|nr:carboxymuconolactone decarboxylase family protein [Pseudomonadales bacterium]